mmetsp:Transcript_12115/g.25811  ORF Transcript_12115/g.25811 Transcript_12115/m.25811 type:complete len:332 (-) Transcript_12115:300-1295(-)|eukprot:CAMPEP_0183740552 /NCGR_PEP_ID=MMETSP0737-20130205/59953_1 /TAXON_ID=385413 /ORGANISM="Thalassiosira miniscula, Strain CCMP1093" /LENGTH=331 /DNA_ID=CAMNT_0025975649 /DNA_START=226 /DNA_END=1221 /DNA_ORIENTATION=-
MFSSLLFALALATSVPKATAVTWYSDVGETKYIFLGEDSHVCRADGAGAGSPSDPNRFEYFDEISVHSLEECQAHCAERSDCVGIEYGGLLNSNHCEIWTTYIASMASDDIGSYSCMRKFPYSSPLQCLPPGTIENIPPYALSGCGWFDFKCYENKICKTAFKALVGAGSKTACDADCVEIIELIAGGPLDPIADAVALSCLPICNKIYNTAGGATADGVCNEIFPTNGNAGTKDDSTWQCYSKKDGSHEGDVTIWWGHTAGDAEWACGEWRDGCKDGGCSVKSTWQCYSTKDGSREGEVTIWWGHKAGDGKWACNNWIDGCKDDGCTTGN